MFLEVLIKNLFEPYFLSILIFLVVILVLLIKDRKNIEREFVIFIRRTEKGRDLLDSIANKNPSFWKYFSSIAVLICFGLMFFGIYSLVESLVKIISVGGGVPGVSVIIPVPSKTPVLGFGFLGVPFWPFIVGVGVLVFVHEGFHGVLMRVEKVRIKSLGLMLLAVLPGAFVEPDEKELKRKDWKSQLRVYAGGSTGNLTLFVIMWLALNFLIVPTFYTYGINIAGYVNSTHYNRSEPFPAQQAGLKGELLKINDKKIESFKELKHLMKNKKPDQIVKIETTERTYNLKLTKDPSNKTQGYMGLTFKGKTAVLKDKYRNTKAGSSVDFFKSLIFWIMILNLGVGIFNLLPIKPLDGGLMLETLSERFLPKHKDKIVKYSSALMITIILAAFLAPVL